ncbi:protein shisa-like-2B [Festucalex cinctus]
MTSEHFIMYLQSTCGARKCRLIMSAECSSYLSTEAVLVAAFSCPKTENVAARFCCGFNDLKYCCDDSNSFYPYDYAYMWWLSIWALVALSFAALLVVAFFIAVCVLCYLFITTKPRRRDNNIPLQVAGTSSDPQEGSSQTRAACASGPQGFRKYFMKKKLHSDNQPPDPERVFQRCFIATVTGVRVENPS